MSWNVDLMDGTLWTICGTVFTTLSTVGGIFIKYIALPTLRRLEKMDTYCDKVDQIHKELTPNGGSSIKDQINSITTAVAILAAKDRAQLELDKRPSFEADASGAYQWVNKAYCRLTGYSNDEIEQLGWKNLVHVEDRERVIREWNQAVADKRAYHQVHRIVAADDRILTVAVEASPLLDPKRSVLGYFGFMNLQ